MLILAALVALAEPPPQTPEATPLQLAATRKLSAIPGVTVNYYDAVGTNVRELHDWLLKHGPRDPRTHSVTPATSGWSIGTAVKFTKVGGKCMLTGTTLKFTATATLPRLAPGQKLPPAVLASWNSYVVALEDRHAARLSFVRDRMGQVESAIMRSNCADWQKAASAAIDRLSDEQARAFQTDPKTQPKLLEPGKDS